MKAIKQTLLAISILILSTSANALEVKTSATALTLCKAEAKIAHTGYKSSTHKKIKQTRGKFKIDLKVKTDQGKINTVCVINKEGEITYSKK